MICTTYCRSAILYRPLRDRMDVDSADHILGLALSVFRTDAVLLHLRDKDEVLAKSASPPAFKPGACAAMCRILEPPPTEMSVVEDPQSDPR